MIERPSVKVSEIGGWKGGNIMEKREQKEKKVEKLPKYEQPIVVTYHDEDILEELGPAQACSPDPCPYP
jgi:hypothetical protein